MVSFEPPPPQRPTLWEGWSPLQLGMYALLLLGAQMFWQVVAYQMTGQVFGSVLIASLLAVIIPCTGAAWWHGQSLATAFDLRAGSAVVLGGLAAGLLAWAPAGVLVELSARLHPPSPEYLAFLRENLPHDTVATVVAFAAAAVVAPLAEELLFRGLLYRTARERWGAPRAAVLVSLFFGVAHWEPWSLFGLVFLGYVLCVLYERTGSLLAPVLAHGVHNAVSLALLIRWQDDLDAQPTSSVVVLLAAGVSLLLLVALLARLRAAPS